MAECQFIDFKKSTKNVLKLSSYGIAVYWGQGIECRFQNFLQKLINSRFCSRAMKIQPTIGHKKQKAKRELVIIPFYSPFIESTSSLSYTLLEETLFVLIDVKLSPWSEEADENGQRTRTISYTLYVNYGFGLKSCPTIETQVCRPPNCVYLSL